MSAVSRG